MDRFTATKKAGVFGIFGNIFLLVIKATVGFISGSQAMIADSVNSAGDIFASLMTFIGNKIETNVKEVTIQSLKWSLAFAFKRMLLNFLKALLV